MTTTTETLTPRIAQELVAELDQEAAITRRCLERIPEDKLGWKPHPKAWVLGDLATFISVLPTWITTTIAQDSLNVAQTGMPPTPSSLAERLAMFDKNVADARAALAGASDEHLARPWTLRDGEKAVLSWPRRQVIRMFALNHIVHHRGQLSVYLRVNDVAVPTIYGPTAEGGGW
jgi:uncharacterized damage-inducible protein DinB